MTSPTLNTQNKNSSWNLSGDYLEYRKEGGSMSPHNWNERNKNLQKANHEKERITNVLKDITKRRKE